MLFCSNQKEDGLEIYQLNKDDELIYLARKVNSNSDLRQINFDVDKRGRFKSTFFRLFF